MVSTQISCYMPKNKQSKHIKEGTIMSCASVLMLFYFPHSIVFAAYFCLQNRPMKLFLQLVTVAIPPPNNQIILKIIFAFWRKDLLHFFIFSSIPRDKHGKLQNNLLNLKRRYLSTLSWSQEERR